MRIDICRARDGIFYDFDGEMVLDDSLLKDYDAKFLGPLTISGRYVTDKGEVYITSKAEVPVLFRCDRCLSPVNEQLVFEVDETFVTEDNPKAHEDEIMHYSSNVIELDDAIKQSLYLALPIQVLCKEDCKGLCPVCGCNLNEEQCSCLCHNDISEQAEDCNSPFAVLKNINFSTGGASNGSTKG